MKFEATPKIESRKSADLLVLPFWKEKKKALPAADFKALYPLVEGPLAAEDFSGKEGEVVIIYVQGQKEPRIALLGLGEQEKASTDKLRRAYAAIARASRPRKIQEINILLPSRTKELSEVDVVRGLSEGLLLANYSFDKLKQECIKEQPTVLLKKATLIGASAEEVASAEKYAGIAVGVYATRDLVNGNADDINPQYLAKYAQDLAKRLPNTKASVFDRKRIEKEKMGLLLAVNRGSHRDPAVIIIEYIGNPKSKDVTALVGKGITYDTGGLNLKPTGSMETMKCDMGGAGAVLGIITAAATIGLKANLIGIIPTTENAIGPASYKPGDVYTSYTGKTVEIGNTDAEGRLVLADALGYTVKNFKPNRIIDFATLTGAIDIALGAEATGMMSNQDELAQAIERAGNETFERVWRLPLFDEYKEQLKSDIADIKNIGGRPAGAITAAYFLKEFVGDTPWVHCDIASTAYLGDARRYLPKHATGVGVRLTIQFLENLLKENLPPSKQKRKKG
jgi:leucyl aminopeptidase